MIENIDIDSDKFSPIQKGRNILPNLADFNVVVGKNSSGKTRLFQAIENKYKKGEKVVVIYIKAQEMVCKDEMKSTDSSLLVKKLTEILTILQIDLPVPNELSEKINSIIGETNNTFRQVIKNGSVGLGSVSGTNLKTEWAVRSILPADLTKGLEKEGQGYQRLVIALFVKECLSHRTDDKDTKEFLILFEEPEICLHSELKRTLKSALVEIAKSPKFQVIISTHDPFFATEISEDGGPSFKRYSLVKDGDVSRIKENYVYGAEDELMHIFLYNKLSSDKIETLEKFNRPYLRSGREPESLSLPKFIRNQIHHLADNHDTIGLIEESEKGNYQEKNYYTYQELEQSIKMMCEKLYEQKEE